MNVGIALIVAGLIGKRIVARNRVRDFNYRVGASSQKTFQPYRGGFHSAMSKQQAILILNLPQNYTVQQIKQSHRKLMMLNHPDNAGSTYLATKINEAKDCLIGS